jgi:mannitol PTS system EIICBA or EIICB component
MLESNPGSGLGVLLAYWFVAAPGTALIHFLGGIFEISFPYILIKPLLVLATMAGEVCGTLTFNLLNAGLVAAPSPGSDIALLAMTPRAVNLRESSSVNYSLNNNERKYELKT